MKNLFQTAKWIWQESACGVNETVDFLTEFTAQKADTYEIYISAQSHYAIYLNGEFVETDQFQDYTFYKVYDKVALPVQAGVNTMQIMAYCQGDSSSTIRPAPGGLIFEIYDGEKLVLASDSNVLCRRNTHYASKGVEWVSGQITYSFRYDATTPEQDWENAVVRDHDWPLNARPIRKMHIDEPYEAKLTAKGRFVDAKVEGTIAQQMQAAPIVAEAPIFRPILPSAEGVELEGNFALIDLGKEMVGYYYMDIEVPRECDIHIGWGEHVEDLRVRTRIGSRNFAALYRAHAGRNIFFYPVKKMGLRYVQLHVQLGADVDGEAFAEAVKGIKLHYAGVRPCHYPYAKVNLFTCADRLHEQIYRICMRTLQGCMHEHYEDCPWREQALYAMDSRNQMLVGYYTFEEYDFAKASLRLMAKSIRPDHLIELMSPGEWPERTIPSFSAFHLIQLGEYLQYSGDVEFIKEILPAACEIAAEFIDRIEENGLIAQFKGKQYWNFFEWQVGLDGGAHVFDTEFAAPMAALTVMALEEMARMCLAVSESVGSAGEAVNGTAEVYDKAELQNKAASYKEYAENLRIAIHKYFWQEDKGYYATFIRGGELVHACELTQALALMCGAVPEELQDCVLETLTGKMGEDFYPVTLSTCLYKYEALLQKPEKYGRFVFNQVADIFGAQLYQGATTFWETEDGACAFNNAGSLCHAWSAIPAYLYMRYCVDSRGEGTKLPEQITGIYEPGVKEYFEASRRVLDDVWK